MGGGRVRVAGGGTLRGWNRFLWHGALYDPATSTYAMRAREYAPQWGRFLSPDPIGQAGGFNVFAFADGRPDGRDPSGLSSNWDPTNPGGGGTGHGPGEVTDPFTALAQSFASGVGKRLTGLPRVIIGGIRDPESLTRIPGAIAQSLLDEYNAAQGSVTEAALLGIGCGLFGSQTDCSRLKLDNLKVMGETLGGLGVDVALAGAGLVGEAGGSEGKLLIAGKLMDHHIFPQQFRRFFQNKGVDIEQFTVRIGDTTHLKGVHGRGLGNMPGRWNARWAEFIDANPGATSKEIYQFGGRLMDEFWPEWAPHHPLSKVTRNETNPYLQTGSRTLDGRSTAAARIQVGGRRSWKAASARRSTRTADN